MRQDLLSDVCATLADKKIFVRPIESISSWCLRQIVHEVWFKLRREFITTNDSIDCRANGLSWETFVPVLPQYPEYFRIGKCAMASLRINPLSRHESLEAVSVMFGKKAT